VGKNPGKLGKLNGDLFSVRSTWYRSRGENEYLFEALQPEAASPWSLPIISAMAIINIYLKEFTAQLCTRNGFEWTRTSNEDENGL
jgi:hypothetical protein